MRLTSITQNSLSQRFSYATPRGLSEPYGSGAIEGLHPTACNRDPPDAILQNYHQQQAPVFRQYLPRPYLAAYTDIPSEMLGPSTVMEANAGQARTVFNLASEPVTALVLPA